MAQGYVKRDATTALVRFGNDSIEYQVGVRTMRSLPVAPFLRDRLEVRLRTRRPWVAAQPFTRLAGPALLDALP